jgi:nucleotide-binding universal stress UspA family protein
MDYKKVLIAVDDSPAAEKIATIGFQLSKQLDAEISLLSVVDTTFLLTDGVVTPKGLAETVKAEFKKAHQLLIEKVFRDRKVWSFVEEGKPHEKILSVADDWDADLIVLGTHGRTGLARALTGSVAEKVIRHSLKPIFVIPTKDQK